MQRMVWLAGLVLLLSPLARAAEVVSPRQLEERVAIRDVVVHDGTVSGTVVNTTGRTLEHVKLVIEHQWLWRDELHPGTDSPGRVDYYTLPGAIPPHGQVPFTYRPSEPLPERSDGHFVTSVGVASVEEVG
jgi:hypothetical protein